ncbi:hypothetical protein BH11PSE11_BH11PSE11_34540 [soil metagenome]
MPKATAIVESLKHELKARGITYAELARRIGMSEASIKRMFAQKSFTLMRLDQILQAAQIDFREIVVSAHDESKLISQLSLNQEKEIVGDPKLFVTAVSALNLITPEQMISVYDMNEVDVTKYLTRLDRIGFLELLPNNRVKLLVSRTFRWIPKGPIQTYILEFAAADYLNCRFDRDDESMQLVNVLLSKQSVAALMGRLAEVAREFSQRHQEDAKLPFNERHPISFLLAARPWLPETFKALVRKEMFSKTIAARR